CAKLPACFAELSSRSRVRPSLAEVPNLQTRARRSTARRPPRGAPGIEGQDRRDRDGRMHGSVRRGSGICRPWRRRLRRAGEDESCNVTVAQGMEGDGKKEDLTVLGGTSTHRTPKVRSSMELLQRLRQRYLQFLQVVVDVLEGGTHYRDFEDRLRQELDALGRDIVKWVAEACDERLREEPQARPGWVVARRGDEKQLLTPFGMVSYERTYFRHRAG